MRPRGIPMKSQLKRTIIPMLALSGTFIGLLCRRTQKKGEVSNKNDHLLQGDAAMPQSRAGRLLFVLIVFGAVLMIGRNLYYRYLNTALLEAVQTQNMPVVRALLDRGADP